MNDYFNYHNYNYNPKTNSKYNNNYELDPYKGFLRGNLFDNLYVPYENYTPIEINPANEEEYDMLMLQVYGFAAFDLTLYLDVNPNDSSAIKLRDKYSDLYKEALVKYENKYGPISLSSNMLDNSPWMWDNKNWPWEGDK